MTRKNKVKSPCILVCQLDNETGWRLGCGRSGKEIREWLRFSPKKRQRVMDTLPERLKAMGLPTGKRVGNEDPEVLDARHTKAERRAEAQRMPKG